MLTVYGGLVVGYIWATYWSSPEYLAAKDHVTALRLLGEDDGLTCSEADFITAFGLLLETARRTPQDRSIATHLENLRWRAEGRKLTLPLDLRRHAEVVSANVTRLAHEREGWLPTSSRDRGWGPEQVLEGPTWAALWSLPGLVLILSLWGYTQVSRRLARSRAHMDEVDRVAREVESLGDFRRVVADDEEP